MPKYTFLLPAFKGRFLDEMLRSIQGQTYTDFKVIISDDCSPEDLKSICEPYLKDPRFTYRRNAENMGSKSLVSHWNLLVDMCDTEFLIMASDDDVYEPQFLEEIDRLTVKYPKVDLFRARVRLIDGEGHILFNDGLFEEYTDHLHFIHQRLLSNCQQCIGNYCFRSVRLKADGGFIDFPLAWGADDATIIKSATEGCCNTTTVLFSFRNSGINISSQMENASIAAYKVKATLDFHTWFVNYFDNIFAKGYTAEPFLPAYVKECQKQSEKNSAECYIAFCQWCDFLHYARRCHQEFSLSFVVLLYYWLRRNIRK